MDTYLQNELREYAWKYFSLHAEQRLKTFLFFVILATVMIGAIMTIPKGFGNVIYAVPLAYILATLAFVFWKLDLRNKELIKYRSLRALTPIEHCQGVRLIFEPIPKHSAASDPVLQFGSSATFRLSATRH